MWLFPTCAEPSINGEEQPFGQAASLVARHYRTAQTGLDYHSRSGPSEGYFSGRFRKHGAFQTTGQT